LNPGNEYIGGLIYKEKKIQMSFWRNSFDDIKHQVLANLTAHMAIKTVDF